MHSSDSLRVHVHVIVHVSEFTWDAVKGVCLRFATAVIDSSVYPWRWSHRGVREEAEAAH